MPVKVKKKLTKCGSLVWTIISHDSPVSSSLNVAVRWFLTGMSILATYFKYQASQMKRKHLLDD